MRTRVIGWFSASVYRPDTRVGLICLAFAGVSFGGVPGGGLAGSAVCAQNVGQEFRQELSPGRPKPIVTMTVDSHGGVNAVRSGTSVWPRLAAEFETPHALMLSVGDWQPHHRFILQEIARKTRGHLPLVVLCSDSIQMKETTRWLSENGEEFPELYLCMMPTDTVWLRDFGPTFMQNADTFGKPTRADVLDFFYVGSRPLDDRLPHVWGQQTRSQVVTVPWTIQGGNLMSNGRGLALTTTRIFEDNHIEFERTFPGQDAALDGRRIVVEAFAEACNLSQLVVLEPLQSEETRHVDMFTTFLSPRDVLVARLDPNLDPVNAAILERNAERLGKIRVDMGDDGELPMQVHRVAIPVRDGTSWSAYTNAILANDLVLMPVFADESPDMIRRAVQTYQRLLPNHHVKTIDMSSMKKLQGELHCLSLHVPAFAEMPKTVYRYRDAVGHYFPE
ncbi:agmatine deiminase family protein [Neorhodopirellula lusitana]|uniref:agmatine deiminase family protein n=1 Tax=Neorhodopirellula lusitana TaxID=445327 RepID=UPI00384F94C9